jgi:hypothetical protein
MIHISGTVRKKKKNPVIVLLKILVVFTWGMFLLLNTWTNSLEFLFHFGTVTFHWNPTPDYKSFFLFNDITLIHPFFIIVKLGHFFGFLIMDLMLFYLFSNKKYAFIISIIFAFITEFFQLFFDRDGRLYDFFIDALGIFSAYYISKIIK